MEDRLVMSAKETSLFAQVQSNYNLSCHHSQYFVADFMWFKDNKVPLLNLCMLLFIRTRLRLSCSYFISNCYVYLKGKNFFCKDSRFTPIRKKFLPLAAIDEYTRSGNLIFFVVLDPRTSPRSSATHAPGSGLISTA